MSCLDAPHFHDEKAAYAFVEARVWPNGPVCPHCGETKRTGLLKGKSTRIGVRKCYACRKPFTVKVGTIFESSHVELRLWLQAIYLMVSSKKGISSNQLCRTLGVTLKTAWFMAHRIREAMRSDDMRPFGAGGGGVEVDETYIGKNPDAAPNRTPIREMNCVMTLVDRDTGRSRSYVVAAVNATEIGKILNENIAKEARLLTDEARHYLALGKAFAAHGTVAHGRGEFYAPGDALTHTQTVENYFSVFKRGMKGVYQHCARKHLHRYCAEFDFRYSNRVRLDVDDLARADRLLAGVVGKRLTYRTTGGGEQASA